MTTRSRPRSYTDRLHQRMAASRKPVRRTPDWLTLRLMAAAIVVVAELGHLAAAVVEWPDSLPHGLFHAVVAALLDMLAVTVYFGQSTPELVAGAALVAATAVTWPAGAIAGPSPYGHLPGVAAAALTLLEAAAATLLALAWWRER